MKKISFAFLVLFISFGYSHAQEKWNSNDAEAFQSKMNDSFSDSLKSPLMTEDLKVFKQLDFYPISEKYAVQAKFVRTKKEKKFKMKTTTSRAPEYKKYGELLFEIDGVSCKLNIYQNLDLIKRKEYKDHIFLPFSDLSCGKETYIGGRYIDMKIPAIETVLIDFNTAYNPYCAYNYKYSCPIVPLENDLKVAILAGVKKFHD